VYHMSSTVATEIKDLSNQRSCATFTGQTDGVTYRYHANGKNCDTTAEQVTIAGAIEHHIKHVDGGKLYGTECLDLTHGGTWDGFLLIGPTYGFDSKMYYGPKLNFGSCNSRGKNDYLPTID
jgi:hypothetical protein